MDFSRNFTQASYFVARSRSASRSETARYQIRSGNLSPKLIIEELFNSRTITAIADLPSGLDNLVHNLSPLSSITVENLIQQHTLYPFYAPFLPPKRAKQLDASADLIDADLVKTIMQVATIMAHENNQESSKFLIFIARQLAK
ncbi:MAG: hypothetical protein QNJ55_08845, partial [Xenococcus sp. MO_188.B8]|nr:hypothetical protein [Xenococcus sp. MO_188.B8]